MSKRITENYQDSVKDDLFTEIEKRQKEGSPNFDNITTASLKEDLIAALELDDEHRGSKSESTAEARSGGAAVEIPKVDVPAVAPADCPPPPTSDKFTETRIRLSDKLEYAIAFHAPDTYGKTVTARNSAYFWQGTEKDLREQFDKK